MKDPFWSKFYVCLHIFTAISLVVYLTTKNTVMLIIAVTAYLLIGIISMDTDRRAEKEYRRSTARALPEEKESRKPYILKTEGDRHRDAQRAMNFDDWNTENHTQPPAIGGTRNER